MSRRETYYERIKRLDDNYRSAYDGLLAEQARGCLIAWMNNFKRLDRILAKGDYYKAQGEKNYAYFVGSVLMECESFNQSHFSCSKLALRELLASMEEKLEEHILFLSSLCGYPTKEISSAIAAIARSGKICAIIDYLEKMERCLMGIKHES